MTGQGRNRLVMPASRRSVLAGGIATAGALFARPALTQAVRRHWVFDNLQMIGGHVPIVQGAPAIIDTPMGPALAFDGQSQVMIDEHPLAGARTFTLEAIFRPDGGAFAQRWFHLESAEMPPVPPGKGSTRILFEIRVVDDRWYLDAFATGPGYRQAMMVPERLHPLGRWYHVAQTFDGDRYRCYVDGDLQMDTALPFTPQGPGRTALGARMNGVDHFIGAIREARFSDAALEPAAFLSLKN